MIMTRKSIILYWSRSPKVPEPVEGCLLLDFFLRPCFPTNLNSLTVEEKDLLRPVIAAHPEYLLGAISMERTMQ